MIAAAEIAIARSVETRFTFAMRLSPNVSDNPNTANTSVSAVSSDTSCSPEVSCVTASVALTRPETVAHESSPGENQSCLGRMPRARARKRRLGKPSIVDPSTGHCRGDRECALYARLPPLAQAIVALVLDVEQLVQPAISRPAEMLVKEREHQIQDTALVLGKLRL